MLRSGAHSECAGAAELAFGSDTAALFLLILSSPLVLTPQSVRTQFRVALGIAYFYRYIYRCLIPGSFGQTWFFSSYQTLLTRIGSFSHTRLDRVSVLLLAKYRYHSISPHCCTVSLSEEMAVLLLDGA